MRDQINPGCCKNQVPKPYNEVFECLILYFPLIRTKNPVPSDKKIRYPTNRSPRTTPQYDTKVKHMFTDYCGKKVKN